MLNEPIASIIASEIFHALNAWNALLDVVLKIAKVASWFFLNNSLPPSCNSLSLSACSLFIFFSLLNFSTSNLISSSSFSFLFLIAFSAASLSHLACISNNLSLLNISVPSSKSSSGEKTK